MKVCPKCRHINEDWEIWCASCNYDIAGTRPVSVVEVKQKKRNKNILIVIIVAACVAGVLLFALFSGYKSGYTLPQWIVQRMQYQKVSHSVPAVQQSLPEGLLRL